jgi:hypothetical protein
VNRVEWRFAILNVKAHQIRAVTRDAYRDPANGIVVRINKRELVNGIHLTKAREMLYREHVTSPPLSRIGEKRGAQANGRTEYISITLAKEFAKVPKMHVLCSRLQRLVQLGE